METSYEEARVEYFSLLKGHVGDLLATCPEFMEILQSDLCVDRFVPKEWTGIKGFPPLDLQVKDEHDQLIQDCTNTPRRSPRG